MKHILRVLVVCLLASPSAAAEPAPPAIKAFVNLVLGACLAEKAGTSLVADPLDPVVVGMPVDEANPDPRLGPGTERIPVTDGVVYHQRDDETCYIYADGIDAEAALADIQQALKSSGVPVMSFSDGVIEDKAGVRRRTVVYGVMVSPTAPTLPLVTVSYPVDQPALMTAGVRAGKAD